MMKEITILAVTKLGDELCVAGVDKDRKWIRPTCLSSGGWRQFYKVDIYDKSRKPVLSLSSVVAINLLGIGQEHSNPCKLVNIRCIGEKRRKEIILITKLIIKGRHKELRLWRKGSPFSQRLGERGKGKEG